MRKPTEKSNSYQLPDQHIAYLNPSADTRISINRMKEAKAL